MSHLFWRKNSQVRSVLSPFRVFRITLLKAPSKTILGRSVSRILYARWARQLFLCGLQANAAIYPPARTCPSQGNDAKIVAGILDLAPSGGYALCIAAKRRELLPRVLTLTENRRLFSSSLYMILRPSHR